MNRRKLSKRVSIALESADNRLFQNALNHVTEMLDKSVSIEEDSGLSEIYGSVFQETLEVPSTEGFSEAFAAAKEKLAQWTVGFRKWKAGGWEKLSPEDKVRAVKKANLTFFYYNPKYVSNLENVLRLTKELSEAIIKDTDNSSIDVKHEKLVKELTAIIKACGGEPGDGKLGTLQKEFKRAAKAYKEPKDAKGDPKAVDKIVSALDHYQIKISSLDALKAVAKSVGMESDGDRDRLETVASIVSWILFLSALWPLWILWLLAGRDFFVNESTGGPEYE